MSSLCDFARSIGKKIGASDEIYDLLGIGCFVGETLVIVDIPELESQKFDSGWGLSSRSAAMLGCGVLFAGVIGPVVMFRRKRKRAKPKQSGRDLFFGRYGMDGELDLPLPGELPELEHSLSSQPDELDRLCDQLFAAEEVMEVAEKQPLSMAAEPSRTGTSMPTPVLPKVERTKEAERGRTIPATGPMQSSGIFGRLWLISGVLLAALLFGIVAWGRLSSGEVDRLETASESAPNGSAYGHGLTIQRAGKYLGVPIKDLPVGTWVLAENPETDGNLGFDYSELDPAELRIVRLRLDKPTGGVLWIERIEHAEFLEEDGVRVGSSQYEEYEDLGIEGEAVVVTISPCPPLTARPSERHCLVTSKFTHEAANVLDLALTGQAEPIGVTANHPIWSEDRQSFIPAGDLRLGERLLSTDGSITTVAFLAPRPGQHSVYNLEVDGEHVYHVSPAGTLVHNSCKHPGKRGGPAHQAMVDLVEKHFKGPDSIYKHIAGGSLEEQIVRTGGLKDRFPDLVFRNIKTGEEFAIQVGKRNRINGLPVARERAAIKDLKRVFRHVFFIRY